MKYVCIAADVYETWLTEGNIYDADVAVSPREFAGGGWLEIQKADDGHKCLSRSVQFRPVNRIGSKDDVQL